MDKMLYDIEVFPNYFCVGLKNYITKEITLYEISEERNDIEKIISFFKHYKGFLISFNGIHYDNMLIKYIIENKFLFKNSDYLTICRTIKEVSDEVINSEEYSERIKTLKYKKVPWIDIDLFLYWSKGLRISKQISLKGLGIQLGYPVVQELPFKPDTILKKEDLPILRTYNSIHDLGILELLLDKMNEDVILRDYVRKEYGLECWSMDAPKIASEYLLDVFCRKTYNPTKNGEYWKYKQDIRNYRYIPYTWRVGDYLPKVNFKTPFFQKIYDDICNSTNVNPYSDTFLFSHRNGDEIAITISQGGIHSVNNGQVFKSDENNALLDADITSLYPTLFRKHKFLRKELQVVLDKYLEVIDDRIEAKRSGDKRKDTFLKLILNSK